MPVLRLTLSLLLLLAAGLSGDCWALNKLGVHVVFMDPYGKDATDYAKGNFGWGAQLTVSTPKPIDMLAGVIGFDHVFLMSKHKDFTDDDTGLDMEQDTRQRYTRVYVGAELGAHGYGFLRPHVGGNLALINYGYVVDVTVRDDIDPSRVIVQTVDEESHWVMGHDVNAGLDVRFRRGISADIGARWLQTYGLMQDLGRDSEKVFPQYVQIYFALAYGFSFGNLLNP